MTDWELLQEYLQTRSDEAFAEIVRRHVGWVASAARRQVRDEHLADDVTQAVFVALAKQASRLHRGTAVSTWLFQVTRYASIHVLRSETRRRHHERKRAAMVDESSTCLTQEQWEEISPVLDELVGRLREKDRLALILRFYEGKALADVGKELGISEEAARKRVDRALEKLRAMLKSKGLGGTSAAGLAGGLGVYVTQSASASQISHVMGTALAAGHGAADAGPIVGIAQGALKMIAYAKAKMIAATALACMLAVATGAILAPPVFAQSRVAEVLPATTSPAPVLGPKETAAAFLQSISKQDRQAMRKLLGTEGTEEDQLADAMAGYAVEAQALQEAVAQRFPGDTNAKLLPHMNETDPAALNQASERIEGDTAWVTLNGRPLQMKRQGGDWRIMIRTMLNIEASNHLQEPVKQLRDQERKLQAALAIARRPNSTMDEIINAYHASQ